MSKFLNGDVTGESTFDNLDTGAGSSTNIFDVLQQSLQTYQGVEMTQAQAQAQAAQAPISMQQAKNSSLFILGAVILGVMMLSRR